MPLVDPVALVPARELGPVHFIAIGGSGMNGIASMMVQLGVTVSGSDRSDSPYLRSLEAAGARVHVGHAAEQLGDAERRQGMGEAVGGVARTDAATVLAKRTLEVIG